MNRYSLQVPYIVSDFKAHQSIKKELISMLAVQNSTPSQQDCENYKESDWYVDAGIMRDYWKFLYPMLSEHMAPVYEELGVGQYFEYSNEWYIDYGKGGGLDWHRHQDAFWASIYYVNLPKGAPPTILKNPFNGSIIEPDIKEGQILTFPGMVEHCSPPCKTNKIVISFNIK